MTDLKPCPFCGGEAEIWRASEVRTAWVACMGKCAVLVSREHTTDEEAVAAWNTRATDRDEVLEQAAMEADDYAEYDGTHDGFIAAKRIAELIRSRKRGEG